MNQNRSPQNRITASEDDDGRPEDCMCWNADLDLPCWYCFRAGFDDQNPAEPGADDHNRAPDEVVSDE